MREKLKAARIGLGMTQQEMAAKLHISTIHYQKIESGERTGSFEIWDALEDLTGIHQRVLRQMAPGKADSQ